MKTTFRLDSLKPTMSWLIKQATRRESFSDLHRAGDKAVTKLTSDVARGADEPKSAAGAMKSLSPGKMQDTPPSFEVGSELWKSRAEMEREQREAHALSVPDYELREEEKEHERDSEAGSELISEFSVRRSKQRARSVQAATIASISPHVKHPQRQRLLAVSLRGRRTSRRWHTSPSSAAWQGMG